MFWEKSTRVGGVLLIAACLFVLTGFSPSLMASNNGTFSAAHFFPFGNPSDLSVPGGATLLRTNRALSMSASVTGLTPGAVYTIWWIIFNNPKACQNPLGEFSACSDLDFPNPRVGAAIVWAAGTIADSSGTASFAGRLRKGRPPVGVFVPPVGIRQLRNPKGAEVHLLAVEHPEAVSLLGAVDIALTTPFGGCGGPCPNAFATIFNPPF